MDVGRVVLWVSLLVGGKLIEEIFPESLKGEQSAYSWDGGAPSGAE